MSIALNPVPGAEYSMDGGETWQDSPKFTGLTPDTAYQLEGIHLHVRGSGTLRQNLHDHGAGFAGAIVPRRTTTTIALNPVPGAEYSMDGGETWQDSPKFTGRQRT